MTQEGSQWSMANLNTERFNQNRKKNRKSSQNSHERLIKKDNAWKLQVKLKHKYDPDHLSVFVLNQHGS